MKQSPIYKLNDAFFKKEFIEPFTTIHFMQIRICLIYNVVQEMTTTVSTNIPASYGVEYNLNFENKKMRKMHKCGTTIVVRI